MPTLNIEGKRVKVDDSFLTLSPEEQQRTVEEIAQQIGVGSQPAAGPESEQSQAARAELSRMSQDPIGSMQRQQYQELPAWQKPLVAAKDVLDLTANGLTFGFGDKAVAAARAPFTDQTYAEELAAQRGKTQAARNRAGGAGTAAEIAGAIALPSKLAGQGISLGGRFGTSAMEGLSGLLARTGLMGVEGAGYGALSAAGNDQDIATGAAIGGAAGGLGNLAAEGISAGISKIAGKFNPKTPNPTVEEIKAAGRAAFKEAEDAGVIFNKNATQALKRNIMDDLTARSFDPGNEPGVLPVLKRLESMGDNVTFEGLASLRRLASNGWQLGRNSNNDALREIVGRIDDLVNASGQDRTLLLMGGDAKAAANAILKARSYWSRARKLELVEKAITRGGENAGAQVSGDTGRTTMQSLKRVLQSEAKTRGFSPAEMRALSSAAQYSPGQRIAHGVGGLMPRDRLSAGIQGVAGIASGGSSVPFQAAGAAVGYAAQKTADTLARKSVDELVALIANGGVPPQTIQNVVQLLAKSKREALSRALMAAGVNVSTRALAQ